MRIKPPTDTTPIDLSGFFQYYNISEVDSVFHRCVDNTYLPECGRAAEYLSFISEQDYADQLWNKDNQVSFISDADTSTNMEEWAFVDALDFIINHITDERVVMLNEAHHKPEGRVFTRRVLKSLKAKGFNYLGIEGLKEDGEVLMQRGFPNGTSGFYIQEPQYGNLIREAIAEGFNIFDYDNQPGRGKQREINQAQAIYRILQKDANAKIIVHAGWGHIREDQDILGGLMAHEFKQISGIDPLTINQCRYISQSKPQYENPLYAKLEHLPKQPSILINKSTKEPYTDRFTDLLIFHNDDKHLFNYPNFFKIISLDVPDSSTEDLIYVYKDQELAKGKPVPIYVTSLKAAQKQIRIPLPFSGSYSIYIRSGNKLTPYKTVTVK